MKFTMDLSLLSKVVLTLVIGVVFISTIMSILRFGEKNMDRQTTNLIEIIDKALVQCYALEGSYPGEISHLAKYGVVFDESRFIYHFEYLYANAKPNVMIFSKD